MKHEILKKIIPALIIMFIIQHCFVPFVMNGSGNYLDTLMKRSITTFTLLTGIKTTLSIIEGSSITMEGGVNFILKGSMGSQIEIGDIVQSVLDVVDYGWKISFFSMIVIKSMIILRSISGDWNSLLFGIVMFCVIIQFFDIKKYKFEKVKKISLFIFLVITMFYIVFPTTVYISGKFSSLITTKYAQNYEKNIGDFSDEVNSLDVKNLKEESVSLDLIEKITLKLNNMANKGLEILDSILTFSIVFFLDIFVIPFIVFYLFYKILITISKNFFTKF
ncbi:MAG: hypothetical protein M0R46_00515 [Candidatus Muirbacterium halophilum]|nr:hypothetical protein [Candidatus Muirbacterium halophilum]MCK9474376.1 hypothetical protein [Candidatus Muirbacterium halophilum]